MLEQAAAELAREVWIVAPAHDQSGTSHSISLHSPLRVARLGDRRFGVVGTPGDCAVLAVRHLMRESPPDLVLSGVNRGANLGIETVFSGTVGAAMTAMLLGLPAIALSQAFGDRDAVPWDTARAHAPAAIVRLWPAIAGTPACLNVNFPDLPAAHAGPRSPRRARASAWCKASRSPPAPTRAAASTTGCTSTAGRATTRRTRRACWSAPAASP